MSGKLKPGDRVRLLENLPYLNLTRRNVGVVVSGADSDWCDMEVLFKSVKRNGTIIISEGELKKVGK